MASAPRCVASPSWRVRRDGRRDLRRGAGLSLPVTFEISDAHFDFDSDQTVVDVLDPALVHRIAEVLDAAVPHPWIGRQLFGMFRRASLLRDV